MPFIGGGGGTVEKLLPLGQIRIVTSFSKLSWAGTEMPLIYMTDLGIYEWSWKVTKDLVCLKKPNTFIIWPITENICQLQL